MSAKKKAAWIGCCIALTAGSEGMRQVAYQDVSPMHVWTICLGETKNVKPGDRRTKAECEAMLEGRLYEFGAEVDRCTKVDLPPARKAGMVDFAYNEGSSRYCKYIAPLLNDGKILEACDHLLVFNTAGGIVFPGLTNRRKKEREFCLAGLVHG